MAARIDWAPRLWPAGLASLAALVGLLAGINPKLALGAAFGCAFVVLAFADITGGLVVLGFFGFTELVPLGGPVLNVTKLAGLLLALSWLAVITTRREAKADLFSTHPTISYVLALFFAWSLASMLWSENPSLALGGTGRYALNAMLFVIVFTAVRTRGQAKAVIAAFIAGAVTAAAYGVLTPSSNEAGRLGSSALDPNELASVLVSGIALSAGMAASLKRSPGLRVAALGATLFCSFALLLTVSRGGLIAFSISLVAAVIVGGRWRARILVVSLLLALGTYFYFAALAPSQARERITQASAGQTRLEEGRTTIWRIAWRAVEANPFTGVGASNFQSSSRHYLLKPGTLARSDTIIEKPSAAHNTYLEILAELGIVGLTLFASVVLFSVGSALRAARNFRRIDDPGMEALAIGLALALIGGLAADFFISQEFSKQLWLLFGLGPAFLYISRANVNREQA